MNAKREPTKRQKEVLDFIADYIRKNGYPPTIREVADNFSISVKAANDRLQALRKKGLLAQGDKKSRTIKLVKDDDDEEIVEVPILGTVAAGRPIMSVENMEGTIRLNRIFFKKGMHYFALRVRGDSMEGAGIREGDIAIIIQQNMANNGEIVVVLVDEEMEEGFTLKTFYLEGSRVKLQPENPKYPVKYYTRDIQILGKLVHIIRSYENGS